MKRTGRVLFFSLLCVSVCAAALAQDDARGRRLRIAGSVQDASGAAIRGARVSVAGVQPPSETRTNAEGRFELTAAAAAGLLLKVESAGFESADTFVEPQKDDAESLVIRLSVAGKSEQVTVAAAPGRVEEESVGLERNADRLNFDEDMLSQLPADGQNPLPIVTSFLSPGAQADGAVSVMVDGVETSASSLPASALRRIRINRNPYAAEFARSGKARIEVYTQEGSLSRFHASASVYGRDSLFDARNALAATKPDLERRLFQGSVSGPLLPGRMGFLLTGERLINNDTAIVRARTPGGDIADNVPANQRRSSTLARLDGHTANDHTYNLSYNYFLDVNAGQGAGGLNLRTQSRSESERAHRLQFAESGILGPMMNEVRIAFEREFESEGGPAAGAEEKVIGAFTGGPSQDWQTARGTIAKWSQVVSVYRGMHSLRFGGESRFQWIASADRENFGGTFEFPDLNAYAQRRPSLFRIRSGEPVVEFSQHEAFGFVQDEMLLRPGLRLTLGARYGIQSNLHDRNNFAPRIALAYSPGSKTVIRLGAGIFYDRVRDEVRRRELLYDGEKVREIVIANPSYPNPLGSSAARATPPSVVRVAASLESPYLLQSSAALERELWPKSQLTVEYMLTRGSHLLRTRNLNAPRLGIPVLPYPSLGNVNQVESSARSQGQALSFTFRLPLPREGSLMAQYTLSRSMDDARNAFALPADNLDLSGEWGRADYDQRHRVNMTANLELPLKLKFSSFVSFGSNLPLNITTGRDDNRDTVANDRPAGTTRNSGIGASFLQLDARLSGAFRAPRLINRGADHRSRNFEIGVDVFNALNRVNANSLIGVVSSPLFGKADTVRAPRTIQFSSRYRF